MAKDETGRVIWDGSELGAALLLRHAAAADGPAVELVENVRSRHLAEIRVRLPAASADALTAMLNEWTGSRGRQGYYSTRVTEWCEREGVPFERCTVSPDGAIVRRTRWQRLFRAPTPTGHIRTLSVEFRPDPTAYRAGIRFSEVYQRPDDEVHDYSHRLNSAYGSLDTLNAFLSRRLSPTDHDRLGDPEDRLIACLAGLVARGELGGPHPPRRDRDQLARWWREAGVEYKLDGRDREHTLVTVAQPAIDRVFTLTLAFQTNTGSPEIEFVERHRPPDLSASGSWYRASTPYTSLETLIGCYSPDGRGSAEDRLIACFEALVATDGLGAGRPHQRNRDRVADWFAAAGVPVEILGTSRAERLLKEYRPSTDCIFTLWLSMDPRDDIRFREHYDYLPRAGDAGREYGYGVRMPYESLATLVNSFETRLSRTAGAGDDLTDRLTACFAALVARGDLAGDLPRAENRNRVAAWFTEANVPHEPTDSAWFNSD